MHPKLGAFFGNRWCGPAECAKPVETRIRLKTPIFLKILNTLFPAGAADLIAPRIPPGLDIEQLDKGRGKRVKS